MKGKNSRARNQQLNTDAEYGDKLTLVFFGLFALLFLISPYNRGLFFHEDYFIVNFFIQVIFLISLFFYFTKAKEFLMDNWTVLVVLFAIPLLYSLSTWYSLLPYYAASESLKWFSYAIVFMMLSVFLRTYSGLKDWLYMLTWVTLLWIVGLVFLVDLGVLSFRDAVIWERFASVFQYPNTYASIISAFLLAGLMGLTKRVSIYYQIVYGVAAIPFMLSFLYTDSRGGILVFALGWVLGLLFLIWKEQVWYVVHTVFISGISLILYSSYRSLVEQESFLGAGLLVLSLTVLHLVLVLVVHKYVYPKLTWNAASRRYHYILPAVVIGLGAVFALVFAKWKNSILGIFPEALSARLANINLAQHSVQERFLFYKDSLAVWQDHFLLGAGGGAWRALFESYKSLPYFSTQAHSFYMQTLVEVGIVGAIFVFGFLFWTVGRGLWSYLRLDAEQSERLHIFPLTLVIVVVMYLHNAIDFNMSYGTYNLFLFVHLAIIWHEAKYSSGEVTIETDESSARQERVNSPAKESIFSKFSLKQRKLMLNSVMGLLILASLFSVYKSYAYGQAEQALQSAGQGGDLNAALAIVDRGIAFNPNNTKLKEAKISMLAFAYQETSAVEFKEEMDEQYKEIIDIEPTIYRNYLRYGQFLWQNKEYDEALEILAQAVEYGPWAQDAYQTNLAYRLEYLQGQLYTSEAEREEAVGKLQDILGMLDYRLDLQSGEVPEGLELTKPLRLEGEFAELVKQAAEYMESKE